MTIESTISQLRQRPLTWMVSGVAGFIGSHLLQSLLELDQRVVGLDNFSTGSTQNLDDVKSATSASRWARFELIAGDVTDPMDCRRAVRDADVVLHHAGLGSVPRSLDDPMSSHRANVDGFLNLLLAIRQRVAERPLRLIYASSSSVYGDHPGVPKHEDRIGTPLSPYALTKRVNEMYAEIFQRNFGLDSIGLRYFNVFGARQNPGGAYAAVIPKWIESMIQGRQVMINGDGSTSRDFCHVENVVQANLLAATAVDRSALNRVYNVAAGMRTSLGDLHETLRRLLVAAGAPCGAAAPLYGPFRAGDVQHSLADITLAMKHLGYIPKVDVTRGLEITLPWYMKLRTGAAAR